MHLGEEAGMSTTEIIIGIPSTSPYICDLKTSPARVEGDVGVQEESGLVFPQVVLQI